jgi:hypothetical protein
MPAKPLIQRWKNSEVMVEVMYSDGIKAVDGDIFRHVRACDRSAKRYINFHQTRFWGAGCQRQQRRATKTRNGLCARL